MQIPSKLRSFSVAFCACAALLAGAPRLPNMRAAGTEVGAAGTVGAVGTVVGGMAAAGAVGGMALRLARRLLRSLGWGLGGLGFRPLFRDSSLLLLDLLVGRRSLLLRRRQLLHLEQRCGQYQTVAPPAEVFSQAGGGQAGGRAAGPSDLIAYPKNGQSEDQLGKDKFECHRWAATQTALTRLRPAVVRRPAGDPILSSTGGVFGRARLQRQVVAFSTTAFCSLTGVALRQIALFLRHSLPWHAK